MADKIQRDALGAEQGPGIAGNRHQLDATRSRLAVARMRRNGDLRVEATERHNDQRQSGDDAGLARDHHRAAGAVLRNGRGLAGAT